MTIRLRQAESELGRAIFSLRQHAFASAAEIATEVAGEFQALEQVGAEGLCHALAASAFTQQGAIEHAGRALESAFSRARAIGDQELLVTCFEIDADRHSFAGRGDAAHQSIQRAAEIHQTRGNKAGIVRTRATMVEIMFMLGRAPTATRLLAGLDEAAQALDGPVDDELVGRLIGAKACAFAHMNDPPRALESYRAASQKLASSAVPSVVGRIAMNVAHYLGRRGEMARAVEVLGDGIALLHRHRNATLEGKLCAAQAFFALKTGQEGVAEEAAARALELSDGDKNDQRRLAILELAIDVAETAGDQDRLTERRLALAELYLAQGELDAAVDVLVADLSNESADSGPVVSALGDVLARQPLNTHPVDWFVALLLKVAGAGRLDTAIQWLEARLAMERGGDRAHLLAARAEFALADEDIATADSALFEAIHIGRLLGLEARQLWIARHQALLE